MFRRFLIYSTVGSSVLGIGVSLRANDYKLSSLGIVRLSRAAITVYDVATTYKNQLFYKTWDKTSREYYNEREKVHKIAAEKLLKLICTNKGVYIKVGQHIGSLDYLLPTEYVKTMKVLHSDAPESPIEDIHKVIKQELKQDPGDIFEFFDPVPLGTASLAQVHKAKLKTGEIVAVKVQHSYVKGNSIVDMRTMEILTRIMSWIFPDFQMKWLVEESKKNLPQELNFLNEGKNAEKIADMFKQYRWLKVPKIYWELSTDRVLVMEYAEGGHVTDLKYIRKHNINPVDVSNKLGQLFSHMIFIKGFVHSDPHPGNILVHKNTTTGQTDIVLLDHGLYAELSPWFRYEYSKLWLSILRIDRDAMKHHSHNLGIRDNLYILFACMVSGRPWESIMSGIDRTTCGDEEKEIIQTNSALLVNRIADILEHVDRQMLLVLKTNDLIRSIETTLKTQNRNTAFWVMSQCCVHSVFYEKKMSAKNHLIRFKFIFLEYWEIFKLNLYYLYLGFINYNLFASIKNTI